MAQVICTLKNASTNINGVKFTKTEHGMVSEEIEQNVADYFLKVNGFAEYSPQPVAKKTAPKSMTQAEPTPAA